MLTCLNITFRIGCLFFDSKRVVILLFASLASYICLAEINLKYQIQSNFTDGSLPFQPSNGTYPCTTHTLCTIDVKFLFSDFTYSYVLLPLSIKIFRSMPIILSQVNPVRFCFLHLVTSLVGSKCVSHKDSLIIRRMGVLLFQIQNLMAALETTISHAREMYGLAEAFEDVNHTTAHELATGFGWLFCLLGCLFYCGRSRIPAWKDRDYYRRRYGRFNIFTKTFEFSSSSEEDVTDPRNKVPTSEAYPLRTAFGFAIEFSICCFGWYHYVDKFSGVLESRISRDQGPRGVNSGYRGSAVKDNSFWVISESWRVLGPNSLFQLLLGAIFFDKMGEFMCFFINYGYLAFIVVCILSQRYYENVYEGLKVIS